MITVCRGGYPQVLANILEGFFAHQGAGFRPPGDEIAFPLAQGQEVVVAVVAQYDKFEGPPAAAMGSQMQGSSLSGKMPSAMKSMRWRMSLAGSAVPS
jgi:hypothetical protein